MFPSGFVLVCHSLFSMSWSMANEFVDTCRPRLVERVPFACLALRSTASFQQTIDDQHGRGETDADAALARLTVPPRSFFTRPQDPKRLRLSWACSSLLWPGQFGLLAWTRIAASQYLWVALNRRGPATLPGPLINASPQIKIMERLAGGEYERAFREAGDK